MLLLTGGDAEACGAPKVKGLGATLVAGAELEGVEAVAPNWNDGTADVVGAGASACLAIVPELSAAPALVVAGAAGTVAAVDDAELPNVKGAAGVAVVELLFAGVLSAAGSGFALLTSARTGVDWPLICATEGAVEGTVPPPPTLIPLALLAGLVAPLLDTSGSPLSLLNCAIKSSIGAFLGVPRRWAAGSTKGDVAAVATADDAAEARRPDMDPGRRKAWTPGDLVTLPTPAATVDVRRELSRRPLCVGVPVREGVGDPAGDDVRRERNDRALMSERLSLGFSSSLTFFPAAFSGSSSSSDCQPNRFCRLSSSNSSSVTH